MKQFYKHKTLNLFYYEDISNEDVIILHDFLMDFTSTMTLKKCAEWYEKVDERTNIYLNLLDEYKDLQMIIAVEELSELQKEICKAMRQAPKCYSYPTKNLTEEIADVEIMLEQVKLYYNIEQNAVEEQKQAKIERTIERCLKDD